MHNRCLKMVQAEWRLTLPPLEYPETSDKSETIQTDKQKDNTDRQTERHGQKKAAVRMCESQYSEKP